MWGTCCRQCRQAGVGAAAQAEATRTLRTRTAVPAPHLPPSPAQNPIAFLRLTDDADRREEATGDVLNFISRITGLACFLHFIF